jgi:hypothetical protein
MNITGNRETANQKLLFHACGCVKAICISENTPQKICTRPCAGCTEKVSTGSCGVHSKGVLSGRTVVGVEYRA